MEFPFGHHHRHHHHGRPESDPNEDPFQNPNPYPNPDSFPPPPPNEPYGYHPPPPPNNPYDSFPPAPPFQHVSHEPGLPEFERPAYEHVGHESGGGRYGGGYHGSETAAGGGFMSSVTHVEHVSHESGGHVRPGGGSEELRRQPTVRIYTKADENYSLSIREGNVVLVPANPRDEYQHWIKDLKYSTRVKDEEGLPSFALINKVTGEAIKHAIKATHPVRLVPYNPDYLDESVLWTESKDTGEGFRCIRMVNNIRLNFDALHGDDNHGGVRDGTIVVLWEWLKGKNQRWKIVPYSG